MMSKETVPTPLTGDNPIRRLDDDALNRAGVASSFAERVLALDRSEGTTVGVFGPWGSGKTSFINLARETFERKGVPVLDFNPWMFSGAEQLVERFFVELSAELKLHNLEGVANAIGEYAGALSGPLALGGTVGKIVAIGIRQFEGGISGWRKKVEGALRERGEPVVMVLDDVDRLSSPEIQEIFKLVRLTANFPNLIYIVACDRQRVEQALTENEMPGQSYLEKIIQFPYNLPEVPLDKLRNEIASAVNDALDGIETLGSSNEGNLHDVNLQIIWPLIRNLRDVRRYAAAIQGTAIDLEGRVELSDFLGLEAVRLFLPQVFQILLSAVDVLTVPSPERFQEREAKERGLLLGEGRMDAQIPAQDPASRYQEIEKKLVESANEHEWIVRNMINILFRSANRGSPLDSDLNQDYFDKLAADGRVAHETIFRFYLDKSVGEDLIFHAEAETAFEFLADREKLEEFMRRLDPHRWARVISYLGTYSQQFRSEHVQPGVVVMLNLLPSMPTQLPFLGVPRGMVLSDFVNSLLGPLQDFELRESEVARILPQLESLYSKAWLVYLIGHREHDVRGRRLVSLEATGRFERKVGDKIRRAAASGNIDDHGLAWVLSFLSRTDQEPPEIDDSPIMTFRILRSAKHTDSVGTDHLEWEKSLVPAFGNKEIIRERVENLRANFQEIVPYLEANNISREEAEKIISLARIMHEGVSPRSILC